MRFLHILEMNSLSDVGFAVILFPLRRLLFNVVGEFLCSAEPFLFDVALLAYLSFCCLCFWRQTRDIIDKTCVKELICAIFEQFYVFRFCIRVFNPFCVNVLYMV